MILHCKNHTNSESTLPPFKELISSNSTLDIPNTIENDSIQSVSGENNSHRSEYRALTQNDACSVCSHSNCRILSFSMFVLPFVFIKSPLSVHADTQRAAHTHTCD